MGIQPVVNAADLPVNLVVPEGYEDSRFKGVIKFTTWSAEEWNDLSSFMHIGLEEGSPTYQTVLWQLSLHDAVVNKVCSPPPRLCSAFEHT